MKALFILNDAAYGNEKAYNLLRLAMSLQKEDPKSEIRIFLMPDAVTCALKGHDTPQGYYNLERMLRSVLTKGGEVKASGNCSHARGIQELPLIEGVGDQRHGPAHTMGGGVGQSDCILAPELAGP